MYSNFILIRPSLFKPSINIFSIVLTYHEHRLQLLNLVKFDKLSLISFQLLLLFHFSWFLCFLDLVFPFLFFPWFLRLSLTMYKFKNEKKIIYIGRLILIFENFFSIIKFVIIYMTCFVRGNQFLQKIWLKLKISLLFYNYIIIMSFFFCFNA